MTLQRTLLCIAFILSLSPLSAQEAGSVFLTLTRKAEPIDALPSSVSVITSAQLQERNPATVREALEAQAGLAGGSYGTLGATSHLMFRGSSPEQVLVMVDGRRVNDPGMGLVDLGSIPIETVERIEIIRGGASGLYGANAFGAVVNIITKQPQHDIPQVEFAAENKSFNTRRYRFAFDVRRDKTSGLVTASKTLSDGYRENSRYDNNNFFVRLGHDATEYGKFDLSGSFFRTDTGVPGMGVSLDQYDGEVEKTASTPDALQKEDRSFIRLEHLKELGKDFFKSTVYASQNNTSYSVPSWLLNDKYGSHVFGSELQYSAGFGTTVGIEWWQELYKQSDATTSAVKMERSRTASALYVQQQWNTGRFGFLPSLRFDSNSAFGTVLSPRITVTARASDALQLSTNAGKAWRAPTFNELYWPKESSAFWGTTYVTEGTPGLTPEEGVSMDIGAEYSFTSAKAQLTAFLTESSNLISWEQSSDLAAATVTTAPQNIGKARQQGFELELQHKIASGLYHQLRYTYLMAEDTVKNKILAYRPCNKIHYEVSYLTPWSLKAIASGEYVSSQETGDTFPPLVDRLSEYALANLTLSQRIAGLELWVKAENITDTKYQTRLEYPLPGRVFSTGVTIAFQ